MIDEKTAIGIERGELCEACHEPIDSVHLSSQPRRCFSCSGATDMDTYWGDSKDLGTTHGLR